MTPGIICSVNYTTHTNPPSSFGSSEEKKQKIKNEVIIRMLYNRLKDKHKMVERYNNIIIYSLSKEFL